VELALLGLELALQRRQLALEGGPLGPQLAACRCRDACWASSRACCCWSWAFSASSCDCCRSRDACWDLSELDSAVSCFCLRSRSAWFALAWLYLSSYSLLGLAGGLSSVAVSRGPL
jgi:hypothetical protein